MSSGKEKKRGRSSRGGVLHGDCGERGKAAEVFSTANNLEGGGRSRFLVLTRSEV